MRSKGVVLWLTGLPAAGKTTLAQLTAEHLRGRGLTPQVLDGDAVRRASRPTLGYTRADREANAVALAREAAAAALGSGVAIVAAITPYASSRAAARTIVERCCRFVEVHVHAPVDVCRERDPKGLYAKALAGQIAQFTGVSDPYEPPTAPDVRIDTSATPKEEAARRIVAHVLGLYPAREPKRVAGIEPA